MFSSFITAHTATLLLQFSPLGECVFGKGGKPDNQLVTPDWGQGFTSRRSLG
jgi:hypothetical protein